ncbi:hypothetical protein V1520DRAFT_376242 [Lipomyces starkeyi]|uniref:Transcription factor domain-containing protein n=1 Tax=Lipomyces starkeyi NRRL Y-11557 TaxID=675824 RepID=A0A1E3Q8V5_LIPST|nr:hypothetical protein LIPSTDRAFT_62105 [Lipomyces starkeyi NRRL Y-11557]
MYTTSLPVEAFMAVGHVESAERNAMRFALGALPDWMDKGFLVTGSGRTLSTSDKLIRSASQHGNDFPEATTSNDHMGSKSSAQPYFPPWPTALGDSILNGGAADALLMHYLDEAFYIQYPFYHSNGRQGRGWLFSILRRDKSAYYAAVALSECHILSTVPPNTDITTNLAQMRAKDGYYDLAFQGLESLTSLLRFLFCELFVGVVQARMGLLIPGSTGPESGSKQHDKRTLDSKDEKLADIKNTPLTEPSLWDHSGVLSPPIHAEISKIFTLSANTYLRVVISGAHPELPEITESVSETVLAFKSLKDPRLLRNAIWLFCISGCLALEEQQSFFRDLVTAADIAQWTVGTCFEAFKIIEDN